MHLKSTLRTLAAITTLACSPFALAQGSPGTALHFDGIDDYVSVPNSPNLNPNPFTISAWAKVEGHQGSYRTVVASRDADSGYILYAADNDHWQFWVGNGSNWNPINGSQIVSSKWTHLAGVYDGSKMTFYVDGVPQGSPIAVSLRKNDGFPLILGKASDLDSYYFNGAIDEVRLWNVARTEADIKANMSHSLTGSEAGLVGYWQLDEGSGTGMTDSTGHNSPGSLTNGPTWTNDTPFASSKKPGSLSISTDLDKKTCADESGLKSINSQVSTFVVFKNQSSQVVKTYWLDYHGKRKLYQTLSPSQQHRQQTYVTHPWVITDENDQCLGIVMPKATESEVVISESHSGEQQAACEADKKNLQQSLDDTKAKLAAAEKAKTDTEAKLAEAEKAKADTKAKLAACEKAKAELSITTDTEKKTCADESGLKSINSQVSTFVVFKNQSSQVVKTYWLDYHGKRKLYQTLSPSQQHRQQTYVTHPWVITDGNDQCLGIVMPKATESEVVISESHSAEQQAACEADKKNLQQSLGDTKAKLAAAEKAKTDLEAKLAAAEKAKVDTQAKLAAAEKAKTDTEAKLAAAEKAKADTEAKLAACEKAKTEAEKAKADTEGNLAACEKAKTEAEKAKADTQAKLAGCEKAKTEAEKAKADTQAKLAGCEKAKADTEKAKTKCQVTSPSLNEGLVAHYPFDGNAQDVSGNHHHGAQAGGVNYVAGKIGQAAQFDGKSGVITATLPQVKKTYSVSMFMKLNSNNRVENQFFYLTRKNAKDRFGYLSTYPVGQKKWHFGSRRYGKGWEDRGTTVLDPDGMQVNQWYHLVFVLNDKEISLHVNGKLLKTITSSHHSDIEAHSNLLFLVGGTTEKYQWMDGLIDEVRVYNRTLSETEIQALMEAKAVAETENAKPQTITPKIAYLGCFKDQGNPSSTAGRDLNGLMRTDSAMTTEKCQQICQASGYRYAGTQYSSQCFCGNSYGRSGTANNCNARCNGNAGQICGGTWANSVYDLKSTH